jgi:exopolyphosphatase/guanosine-5'-triphosphate,3'-diphosphate pyrophosphatase
VEQKSWDALHEFARQIERGFPNVIGIGTGGNINRIFKEAGKVQLQNLCFEDIERVKKRIHSYSFEERLHLLKLKPDRADVIIPAADIYQEVMRHTGVKEMIVPKIGLSDGLILRMFDSMQENHKLT